MNLAEFGLKMNLHYLGHLVSGKGFESLPEKIEAIKKPIKDFCGQKILKQQIDVKSRLYLLVYQTHRHTLNM